MVILVKKFLTKFTKIWNFIPNMVFGDKPVRLYSYAYNYITSLSWFGQIKFNGFLRVFS